MGAVRKLSLLNILALGNANSARLVKMMAPMSTSEFKPIQLQITASTLFSQALLLLTRILE
jgi:hypothetical protein